MPIYVVTCALKDVQHDYARLWGAFERAGAVRALESTWFVDTTDTIDVVNGWTLSYVAANDGVVVIQLEPDTRWAVTGIQVDAKAWLQARMSSGSSNP